MWTSVPIVAPTMQGLTAVALAWFEATIGIQPTQEFLVPVLSILVPARGCEHKLGIDRGSAIVGLQALHDERVLVYFEGNRYRAENLRRFDQRIETAAGRLTQRYPTIARASVSASDLTLVGTFSTETRSIAVLDKIQLREWAGEDVEAGQTIEALKSTEYKRVMGLLKRGQRF